MTNKMDTFLDNLQDQVFEEARDALGEKGFNRWRNPKFQGKMENPDAHGSVTGICGDTMDFFFKIENDRVTDGSYTTTGCASSSISGSFAIELAMGKTVDELADISGEDVLNKIGKLPDDDQHCAFLASETIQNALANYMNMK